MQIAADTMDWIEFLDNTIRLKRKWIPQDIRTIWLTRWRFIRVKYFKGFTTTIYRSDTKVIKFVPEAWSMKTHIYVIIKFDFFNGPALIHHVAKKFWGNCYHPMTKNQPPLKTRWMYCFSCEADVCCRRGRWQIHFQSSLGYRGTSWKPKTKFPLKFFSVAVRDSSIVFLFRGERTFKNFQKERYIYKGVLQNTLAPSTVCVKASYVNSFCYVS